MNLESKINEKLVNKLVLGIETSCDETAVCIIGASFDNVKNLPKISILGNSLMSQAETHSEYGGVFPAIAKREHSKNIVPLFVSALKQAGLYKLKANDSKIDAETESEIRTFLSHEPEMAVALLELIQKIEKPALDLISVTQGPGLEPALWVGINFAKSISKIWRIPVEPTNHMEGHILSVLIESSENTSTGNVQNDGDMNHTRTNKPISFPAIALLISGGHTELVLIKNWHEYSVIGRTRDDAVGEAFDKVARILGFPYPGGPKISELAKAWRDRNKDDTEKISASGKIKLPRPMIKSDDFDFSFSGLKTAVLYLAKDLTKIQDEKLSEARELTAIEKQEIACEFENAVAEVLIEKTKRAMLENGAIDLIIGGGVIANKYLREEFEKMIQSINSAEQAQLLVPSIEHSTDNAIMIALAGYMRNQNQTNTNNDSGPENQFRASGNLSL